jgi:hypothetical protein
MQGTSGTYAFNGTALQLLPTEGRWIAREAYGVDGNGHSIYSPLRQFEMTFALETPSDFDQIRLAYDAVAHTGTVIVDLPQYDSSVYQFKSYTGCIIQEPTREAYFEGHIQDVLLLITNIRT